MIVDVHAYIGKWPYWPVPYANVEDITSLMQGCGIDRAVISSTRCLFTSWRDGNAETRAASDDSGGRLIAFECVGPPELSHSLNPRYEIDPTHRIRGIRLFPQFQTYHLLFEPFVDTLCEQAAAMQVAVQLPLRVLMNWGMPALELPMLVAIIERHPRVPWILTGLNYFHELRVGLALMRRYPSVHLETSCVQGFQAIRKIVEQCGSGQLLFGTGLPMQNPAVNITKLKHARIAESDREAIFAQNAVRLLRLPETL